VDAISEGMALIAFLTPLIAVIGILGWLAFKGRTEYVRERQQLDELFSLPVKSAMERAQHLLQDCDFFICVPLYFLKGETATTDGMTTKDFFNQYAQVRCVHAPWVLLNRDPLIVSGQRLEPILIGRGMEGTDLEFELFVRPNDETIYEKPLNIDNRKSELIYPTIWHWVLAAANEMNNNRSNRAD
jgi:hypothetical protein